MVNSADAADNARRLKLEIQRAKSYLGRYDVAKSIDIMLGVLRAKAELPVIGTDKYDLDMLLSDYCADFNKNPRVLEFLETVGYSKPQYLLHAPHGVGRDVPLLNKLAAYRRRVSEREMAQRQQVQQERMAKCEALISQGMELLSAKEFPKGRVALKKAAEQFFREPGVLTRVGTAMLQAGFPKDASEILKKALELYPKDQSVYRLLIEAYNAMGKPDSVEGVYLAAVKQFGPHPTTYLNMSKFFQQQRKREQSLDYARRAYDLDPTLEEAKFIMDNYGYY